MNYLLLVVGLFFIYFVRAEKIDVSTNDCGINCEIVNHRKNIFASVQLLNTMLYIMKTGISFMGTIGSYVAGLIMPAEEEATRKIVDETDPEYIVGVTDVQGLVQIKLPSTFINAAVKKIKNKFGMKRGQHLYSFLNSRRVGIQALGEAVQEMNGNTTMFKQGDKCNDEFCKHAGVTRLPMGVCTAWSCICSVKSGPKIAQCIKATVFDVDSNSCTSPKIVAACKYFTN